MATPVIKTNFSAGELTPHLWGHVDLGKYQGGCKTVRNFFVDHRGGLTNRSGTGLVGYARNQSASPRLMKFRFGSGQSYELVFDAHFGMQIILDGAMVTETPIAITAGTLGNPLTLTAASGAWAIGDMIVVDNVIGLDRPNGVSGVNGRTFIVDSAAVDVLTLDSPLGPPPDSTLWTAYVSGGTIARILTVPIPWQAQDLFALKFAQSADTLTVTHPNYAQFDIEREGPITWTVTPTQIGSNMVPPTGATATAVNNPGGSTPQFFYPYAVSSVNDDTGEESNITGATATVVNAALDQTTSVVNKITWDAAPNATSYKIYAAQNVPNGSQDSGPYFYGLMGTSKSTSFADVNFTADFTAAPPTATNPFSSGPFSSVTMVNDGFGYIDPVATVFDFTGSGALLTPTTNSAGAITATAVTLGGDDYSAPNIVFTEGDPTPGTGLTLAFSGVWVASGAGFVPGPGSLTINAAGTHYHVPYFIINVLGATGAFADGVGYCTTAAAVPNAVEIVDAPFVVSTAGVTLSFTISDTLPGQAINVPGSAASALPVLADANFPAVVAYFDQRRIFAGSNLNPDTFWTTRPGQYNNFDVSFPSAPNDAITGTIVGQEVNQIESLTAMTSGLVALTSAGMWQIAAAGSTSTTPQPLDPASATAGPQAFTGASSLPPLRVGIDLVYEAARGGTVRASKYNFYANIFTGFDVSSLSQHLLQGRTIVQWAYAEQPYYLIWAVRDDGIVITLTYLPEQDVYGWARHDTRGIFTSVDSIPENDEDAVYYVTQRPLGNGILGGQGYFIERMHSRSMGENLAANIPPDPDQAWFLDCAVQFPLTFPNDTLAAGSPQPQGQLDPATASIDAPGINFPDVVTVIVTDLDGNGTGCDGYCTASGGAINAFVITSTGQNYVNPQFIPQGGVGGALSVKVINLAEFAPGSSATLADMAVGDTLRVRGGKGTVHSFTANTVLVDMARPVTGLQANAEVPNAIPVVASGGWSCTTPVQTVGGLDHLNGSTVGIVVDGNCQTPQVVIDGCITLAQPGTAITIGLLYSCQAGGLPVELGEPTVQGRRKQQPAITLRMMDARGVSVGSDWQSLVEVKQRAREKFGEPITFQTGGGLISVGGANPDTL